MCSRFSVFINGPFFSMCRMSSVSSIAPYACCVSKMCWAYLEVVLLECDYSKIQTYELHIKKTQYNPTSNQKDTSQTNITVVVYTCIK
jgi:hypothetical protein